MSKKRNKFDLTGLVHEGSLSNGQTLYFVSDPGKTCQIAKQPNGEYKVTVNNETMTVHAFAQKCLGQDPPDHAARWLRTDQGVTLYDIWQQTESYQKAA